MSESKERYEKITAIVDCGRLRWEYRIEGMKVSGRQSHDEEVEDWSDDDVIDVTMATLDVPKDQRGLIKVEYA
jgi:hypothetical protein